MHTHMQAHTHTRMYTYMHTHTHIYTRARTHTHTNAQEIFSLNRPTEASTESDMHVVCARTLPTPPHTPNNFFFQSEEAT